MKKEVITIKLGKPRNPGASALAQSKYHIKAFKNAKAYSRKSFKKSDHSA